MINVIGDYTVKMSVLEWILYPTLALVVIGYIVILVVKMKKKKKVKQNESEEQEEKEE